jgi:hypothetical protein
MKVYTSYVAEAQARYRRRIAAGVAGVLLLAVMGAAALVVLEDAPTAARRATVGCASDARSPAPACAASSLRREG